MKRFEATLALALVLALFAGVGCKKHVKTPDEFAEMKDPGWAFEYRAISPDEVVIGVQKKPNEPKGDAAFWAEVWEEKYPPIKDYEFVTREEIATDGGLEGMLLEYTSEEEDGLYGFLVAIYVVKKNIWIVSAGGKVEAIDEHRDDILTAFRSFKP